MKCEEEQDVRGCRRKVRNKVAVKVVNRISVMNQREALLVSMETVCVGVCQAAGAVLARPVPSRPSHCISVLSNLACNFELVTRRSCTRCAAASSTHSIGNSNFLFDRHYYLDRVQSLTCAISVNVRVFWLEVSSPSKPRHSLRRLGGAYNCSGRVFCVFSPVYLPIKYVNNP